MGTEAANSIDHGSAGVGTNTSTSSNIAADMVNGHRTAGALDTTALAADVQARAAGDPQAQAELAAQVDAQLTNAVDRGNFSAAMQAANDNPDTYGVTIEGTTFSVGHPDAPAVSTWGTMPAGQGYKETWDATATRLGTTDPAAITADIEAQLSPPTVLDTIVVEGEGPSFQPDPSQPTSTQQQPAGSEEGVGSFFEGMVKGDFGDNDSWSATAGQVIGGFIPFVGQAADARDTAAAINGVANGEEGAWGNLGLAALGWLPGGDIAKAAIRGGDKVVDAGGEVAGQVARHGDDVVDGAGRQVDDVAGGVAQGALRNADGTLNLGNASARYAEVINENKPWSWADDFAGDTFNNAERRQIKQAAVDQGLIPEVRLKPGTRYADFAGAGVVQRTEQLPENLWHASDREQFAWLDARIPGGRPEGTTWHHSEIDGRMELVPFGVHNINPHIGGRSPGHWADAPR